MGLIRWFTQNVCDTDVPTHEDVKPLELPTSIADAPDKIAKIIPTIRGWQVQKIEPTISTIFATRRTRIFRFVDDVILRLEATPNGVRIHGRSQSRIGKGDLGQNRRNLLALFRVLQKQLGSS